MAEASMEERVRALETSQAETRIYVKEIRDDIQEIKTDIKSAGAKTWSPIVLELIKVITICLTIIGTVKFMGKG